MLKKSLPREGDFDGVALHLGLFQFIILRLVQRDPEEAYAFAIARKISRYRVVDNPHINRSIRQLAKRGFLVPRIGVHKINKRVVILYEITEKGITSIRSVDAILGN